MNLPQSTALPARSALQSPSLATHPWPWPQLDPSINEGHGYGVVSAAYRDAGAARVRQRHLREDVCTPDLRSPHIHRRSLAPACLRGTFTARTHAHTHTRTHAHTHTRPVYSRAARMPVVYTGEGGGVHSCWVCARVSLSLSLSLSLCVCVCVCV